ncbi:MAG: metal ABC transporter permease [Gammaproteobacteria bacterium]|nr:metal ABC transporter permease [Gammaproteobacteria bacterium]
MNWEALDITILGPAFLTGAVVLATHVPLGRKVLERGIIFLDLAVAQMAGLGVIAAHSLNMDAEGAGVQTAAFTTAIIGAFVLYWIEGRWAEVQEAIIGSAFVLAATAAILLLANDPQGGEHLKELLVGQILWSDYASLGMPAMVSLGVLIAWFVLKAQRSVAAFYGLFAISITVAVQMVGVYLVFASLIIPALGSRSFPEKSKLPAAYGIGVAGYGMGLVLSALLDLPAGPAIVWMLAIIAGMAVFINSQVHQNLE